MTVNTLRSAYMNIIIVGCGTVGAAICAQLSKEGHDITVVDSNTAALSELCNTCDVFGVEGSGASISVLRKAGADPDDVPAFFGERLLLGI